MLLLNGGRIFAFLQTNGQKNKERQNIHHSDYAQKDDQKPCTSSPGAIENVFSV
jgi:hypothetical protein